MPLSQLAGWLAAGKVVRAEWSVYSETGPDWAGAGREVKVFVDEERLSEDTDVYEATAAALIDFFGLPETSRDYYYHGEGVIECEGDQLFVDYEFNCGIPYAQSDAYAIARESFFDLSKSRVVPNPEAPWRRKRESGY
jgi:hypothetical protein